MRNERGCRVRLGKHPASEEDGIECHTGSGKLLNLFEVGREIARRLPHIFLRNPLEGDGGRVRHTDSGQRVQDSESDMCIAMVRQ
jgi:hypothetical protein